MKKSNAFAASMSTRLSVYWNTRLSPSQLKHDNREGSWRGSVTGIAGSGAVDSEPLELAGSMLDAAATRLLVASTV